MINKQNLKRGDRENDNNIFTTINELPLKDNNNKNMINNHKKKINMNSIDESYTTNQGNNFLHYKNISKIDNSDNSVQVKKNNSNSSNMQTSIGSNYENSTISTIKPNNSNDFKSNSGNQRKASNISKTDLLKNEGKIIEIEKKLISLQKSKEQVREINNLDHV